MGDVINPDIASKVEEVEDPRVVTGYSKAAIMWHRNQRKLAPRDLANWGNLVTPNCGIGQFEDRSLFVANQLLVKMFLFERLKDSPVELVPIGLCYMKHYETWLTGNYSPDEQFMINAMHKRDTRFDVSHLLQKVFKLDSSVSRKWTELEPTAKASDLGDRGIFCRNMKRVMLQLSGKQMFSGGADLIPAKDLGISGSMEGRLVLKVAPQLAVAFKLVRH